jgi:hypothetical protein
VSVECLFVELPDQCFVLLHRHHDTPAFDIRGRFSPRPDEGAESRVLRGAARVMHDARPVWILSLHNADEVRRCAAVLDANATIAAWWREWWKP